MCEKEIKKFIGYDKIISKVGGQPELANIVQDELKTYIGAKYRGATKILDGTKTANPRALRRAKRGKDTDNECSNDSSDEQVMWTKRRRELDDLKAKSQRKTKNGRK